MATPSPPIVPGPLIEAYAQRLCELLHQCADDRAVRPDAFFWNARRCLEVITYANYIHREGKELTKKGETSAADALVNTSPGRLKPHIEAVRHAANRVVHVQDARPIEISAGDISLVQSALSEIVTWFFEEVASSCAPQKSNAQRALAAVWGQAKSNRELHEEQQRNASASRDEVWAQNFRQREVEPLERQVALLKSQLADARRELDRNRGAAQDSSTTPNSAPERRDSPSKPIWIALGLLIGMAVAAVVALIFQLLTPQASTLPGAGPSASLAVSHAPPTPSAPFLAISGAPKPSTAPSGSSPPSKAEDCPLTMLRIPAGTVLVAQPKRPGWPAEQGAIVEERVPAFCIDKAPVTAKEYQDCQQAGVCRAFPGKPPQGACHWSGGSSPINCLSWDEAEEYCSVRTAQLPSVVQWERAATQPNVNLVPETAEWALDAFPAAVFHRGPPLSCTAGPTCKYMVRGDKGTTSSNPSFSWNHELGTWDPASPKRRPDIGFRCVKPL